MSSYVFAAVYQQQPTAVEGNFFRRAAFRYWRAGTPWPDGRETIVLEGGLVVTLADCWRFATMDVAASKKTTADWTVLAMWAVTPMGDLILLDRRRERVETHDHFSLAPPLLARWGDATIYVERQFYSKTFVTAAREAGVGVAEVIADTDKITRAVPAAGRVHAGKVFFPADAAWLGDWEDEVASFPKAAHDDQVDVLAYAERVRIAEWTPKTDPPPRRRDPVQEAIDAASSSATGNGHGQLDIMHQGW
jgi:predicted phage terminase large subunit-like protein